MEKINIVKNNPDGVNKATIQLANILKSVEDADTYAHVIFKCGTVIRLNSDVSEFKGFTDDYDFPDYRLANSSDKQKIMQDNTHNWKWSQTLPHAKLVARAYYILIDDGYPYPGGEGADRYCVPLNQEHTCMLTIFHHRKWAANIFTLSYMNTDGCTKDELTQCHQELGKTHRRYDYMMPLVYAVIDEKSVIHTY